MRWALQSLIIIALVGSGTVLSGSVASAASACAGYELLGDGEISNGNSGLANAEGVRATIRVENAALCPQETEDWNTSSAWVMIAENPSHAVNRGVVGGLAQVGFLKNPSHSDLPRWFYESGRDDAGSTYYLWHAENGRSPGETHTFWVSWNSSCTCLQMRIDSVAVLAQTTWNPFWYWGFPYSSNPWESQFAGESHDWGTDVPGGDSGGIATVFSNVSLQDAVDDSFDLAPCLYTPIIQSSRYGQNGSANHGCGSWSIFTKGI